MSKPTAFIDKKQLEFLQVGSQLAVPNQFYDSQLSRVYKAAHLTLAGGQVTKVLVKEYVELGQDVFNKAEFFIAEAKKFRELEHPQIIKFHGVVLNTNSIILEYYAHSLRDVITMSSDSNSPFLSMEDRLACSEDMAEAMYFLHSSANHHKKAVLHRNLQSTSVLVKRDEVTSVLRAKITDFGSSTTLKDNPTSFNNRDKGLQSNASSILRSVRNLSIAPPPHVVNSEHGHKTSSDQKSASLVSTTNSSYIYIAPEIKRKSVKEYGKPCDVFSYGIVLLELITLKQPEEAVLANISTISEISTSNPHDLAAMQFLKEISLNCLQTKPEHRPDFSQIKSKFNACLMNGDYQELRVKDVHYMQKSEMVEEVASNLNHNNESFEGQRMETSRFTFKESQLSGHYHHDDGPASIQIPVSLFETSILNPAAKHFQTPIQAAKRRQNGGLLISVVIMIVLAAIGIILGVMLTRKPSGSNNNNLSNSVSNSTTSSTTPKSMWGGITSLSLYGLPSVDQNSIIYNMKSANLKIVRTYLKPIPFHGFGTNTFQVFDLEPGPVGVYNDTILSLYDDLMLKLYNAGIKMIINLHDRFDLGCDFSGTFYVATGAFCNVSYNTAEVFYTSEYLTSMFDARLAHILTHRNPNFDNRQWGELSEVIYSVNIQEQAQEGMLSNYTYQPDWYCQRAAKIKPLLKGVLLGTGGGKGSPDSVRNDILECSSIDVVSIFDKTYDNPTYFDEEFGNFSKIVQNFPDKQIIFENFDSCVSTDAQQQQQLEEIISRCNYYRIPWVAWAIYPGSCSVKTTSSTWTMIGQRAAEAFSLTNSSNTVVEISN